MKTNLILIVLSLIFLESCSRQVVKRTNKGMSPRDNPRQYFTGVKKKIVLLSFFNESPYGGEDLGIIATEEMRNEISKTGQFIIDQLNAKMFGSSKEIYAGGGVKLVQLSRKAKIHGINFVVFGRAFWVKWVKRMERMVTYENKIKIIKK